MIWNNQQNLWATITQSGALEAKQISDVGDDWKVAIQTSSQDFINAGVSIKKNAQEAGSDWKQAIQEGSEHFIQASEQVKSNAENAGVSFSTQIQNSGSVLDEGSKGLEMLFLVSGTQFKVTMEASGDIVQKAIDSAVRWEESLNASSEKLQIVIADSGKQLQDHASQASQQFAKDVEASSEKLDLGISATQKALELLSQALVSSSHKRAKPSKFIWRGRVFVWMRAQRQHLVYSVRHLAVQISKFVNLFFVLVNKWKNPWRRLIKDYQILSRGPQRIWWPFQKHKSNCKVGLSCIYPHTCFGQSQNFCDRSAVFGKRPAASNDSSCHRRI